APVLPPSLVGQPRFSSTSLVNACSASPKAKDAIPPVCLVTGWTCMTMTASHAALWLLLLAVPACLGIASEHPQHVFTPFFTTKSQGKGMWLGVSSARETIRAHHGTVSVKSRGGEGTTSMIDPPPAAA